MTKRNKKVLLRERKRHTDRGISSTPSVVLYWGGGGGGGLPLPGVPHPCWGYLTLGTPPSDLAGGGYPTSDSPHQTWLGGVPHPCWGGGGYPTSGTPPAGPGWGTPLAGPGRGTPPPVDRQTDTYQNITFPSYYGQVKKRERTTPWCVSSLCPKMTRSDLDPR